MTDEEKTEEYLKEHIVTEEQEDEFGHYGFILVQDFRKKAFLDGLAEGRKELEKENAEKEIKISRLKEAIANEHTQFLETRVKLEKQLDFNISLGRENTELKKQISVLLSCVNCSENKGGYICEKEYNDKCLAQKIEYIKELTKENAELSNWVLEFSNSIIELETQIEKMKCCGNCKHEQDSNTNYYCENCKRFANETDVDKWELAE